MLEYSPSVVTMVSLFLVWKCQTSPRGVCINSRGERRFAEPCSPSQRSGPCCFTVVMHLYTDACYDNDNILFVPGITKIQIYNKYTLIHVLTRAIRNSYKANRVR